MIPHGYYTTEKKVADALDRLQKMGEIAAYFHYAPCSEKDAQGIDFDVIIDVRMQYIMPLQVKGSKDGCRAHRKRHGKTIPVINVNKYRRQHVLIQALRSMLYDFMMTQFRKTKGVTQ